MIELDKAIKIADDLKKKGFTREGAVEFLTALNLNGDMEALLKYNEALYAIRLPEKVEKPVTPSSTNKYITVNKNGDPKLDIEILVKDLLDDFHFATYYETDEILIYIGGFYQLNGERFIKDECESRVGVKALLTTHNLCEITGHIQRSTYVKREKFNNDASKLCLKNGLLEIASRKLLPHDPAFLTTIQLPLVFDASKDCPLVKKFLGEVLSPEDVPVMQEFFGYCAIKDNNFQKAFLLVGDGNNGKSTTLDLLKSFVGKENCANMSWQSLEYNRFSMSALEGKLVNVFADLPSRSLDATTAFKMLTGGDTIGAEKKFRDAYSFVNYARLIFSTNKPPIVEGDDSYAFWRRWVIIQYEHEVPADKRDKKLKEKLSGQDELSGLLNFALDGLDRLMQQQEYSYKRSVEEVTDAYLKAADPIFSFISAKCEIDPMTEETKNDIYDAYKEYCEKNRMAYFKPDKFGKALLNQPTFHVKSTRPTRDGERVTCWSGIRLIREEETIENKPSNPDNPSTELGASPQEPELESKPTRQTPADIAEILTADMMPSGVLTELTGLTLAEIIQAWHELGSPVVHVPPGNVFDLEKYLLNEHLKRKEDIQVLAVWIEKTVKVGK